jgi:catechol 2,3-dioxygenase-like lactoylglutathione lyase family enzyme
MSIIDHVTLAVGDYKRAKVFYEKALAPLGIKPVRDFGQACGFGRNEKPEFWIGSGPTTFQTPEHLRAITPNHVAFAARSRGEVEAFYRAALDAGGKEYYGAFVLDLDGHNIEAVFHGAWAPALSMP